MIFPLLCPCINYRAIKYAPVSIEFGKESLTVPQTLLIQGDNLSPCILYRGISDTGASYCTNCALCSERHFLYCSFRLIKDTLSFMMFSNDLSNCIVCQFLCFFSYSSFSAASCPASLTRILRLLRFPFFLCSLEVGQNIRYIIWYHKSYILTPYVYIGCLIWKIWYLLSLISYIFWLSCASYI